MGLFKKKEPPFNEAQCLEKKAKMRELFNDGVENGGQYRLLKMSTNNYKFERGLVVNTRTTTFQYYILGYRPDQPEIIIVPIDPDLTVHGSYSVVDLREIKDADYYNKIQQLAMTRKAETVEPGDSGYYIFNIGDSSEQSLYMKNIRQAEEREGLLALAEKFFPIKYKK